MLKNYFYCLLITMAFTSQVRAQQTNMKTLPLEDMTAFRSQAGNWRIVGDVTMDPSREIAHETAETPPVETKKGKKNKGTKVEPAQSPVTFTAGNGILLNMNDQANKDHLVTAFEHGDLELELEVMLPKGSNSGIYLQGRYEVQLFDSWGTKNAKYSDIGGIYRNWEKDPGKIYMGKAPLTNAAKAPGLWQKMKIAFRAPRFDANGKKIENAKFISVFLNGVQIHDNVSVPLPTGGPLENNETAMGPLMIQGDHGPVSFRNIRYRLMKELDFKLSPISYEVFHGEFSSSSEIASLKPVVTGTAPDLSIEVVDVENGYGVRFKGQITVPEDALYMFRMHYTGGGKLTINDKELMELGRDSWVNEVASIQLKAGTHPFEIINFKNASWIPARLALYINAENSYPKALHVLNSHPPSDKPVSSIYINAGTAPRLLRAFIDFKGNRKDRLTHTIGVGDPTGLNYVYDLRSGNLVCVWRGDFADATPMWHDRGDGSFKPRGANLFLFNNQALALLNSQNDAFPTAAKEGEFRGKGYSIDESTNRPVFRFTYEGIDFEDRVFPDDNNLVISHEIIIKNGTRKEGLYYKIAEGSNITSMPDGSYAINDKEYYVKVAAGVKPFIREVNNMKELVAPFPLQSLKYSIIW